MKLYKLTDQDGKTRNDTCWLPLGTVHETDGTGELCGPGWLHAYTDPLLAVLMNPVHAKIQEPRLFEAEGEVGESDRGLKVGTTRLVCTREIPLPVITTEQRVKFAILASLEVFDDPRYRKWAESWMSGEDRTADAARAAWANLPATDSLLAWAERAALASVVARAATDAVARWAAADAAAAAAASAVWRLNYDIAIDAARAAHGAAIASNGSIDLVAIARKATEK